MKIPKPFTMSPEEYEDLDIAEDYYENQAYDYDETSAEITSISMEINLNLQSITWLINIFHLIVLSRKQLRSNAIFIYMIAVAISDLVSFGLCNWDFELQYTDSSTPRKIVNDVETYYCMKPKWMPIYVNGQIRSTVFELTKRLSVWFSIVMCAMRTASVMYPMSPRIHSVTSVKSTLAILAGLTVAWLIEHTWHIWWFFRYVWFPDIMDKYCPKQPKNETQVHVIVVSQDLELWLSDKTDIAEVVLKFLPFLIYPILTLLLLCTIRSYKKKRKNSVSAEKKSDRTNGLVLLMTVTFMLSEGFAGLHGIISYTEQLWMRLLGRTEWPNIIHLIELQFPFLRTINCLSHVVVCILMSNQYRDAIKSLFCCCKKEKPWNSAATVVRKSTSVSKTSSLATIA